MSMAHSFHLNSGIGIGGTPAVGAGCGRRDTLNARTSVAAACRKYGRSKPSFTPDDVVAAYPQHARSAVHSQLNDMVLAKLAYRVRPGVYRLAGEV